MNVQEELLRQKIDPHLTKEKLESLAAEATGEKHTVRDAVPLSGGCWNRVLRVSFEGPQPDLVFKISPNCRDEKVTNEYLVHKRFAEIPEMRTPRPYLLDTSQRYIPGTIFIMELIPGQVMHSCFSYVSNKDQDRIIETIAADTAALHRIKEPGFGSCALPVEKRSSDWPSFWLPRFDEVIRDIEKSGLISQDFLHRVAAVRKRLSQLLDIGATATLTHYDIWSGNVMIDLETPGGPQVSGYIDISGFFADYARELSFAELFGIADGLFYRRYQEQHEIDSGFRLRTSIYNLKMSLRHVMMYPDEGYYRQIAESCLAFIEAEV